MKSAPSPTFPANLGSTAVADILIVGAGPVGLMLAAELRLAGVTPVVLERLPHLNEVPKAGGLGGQILGLLRYRGLLERLESASPQDTHPAPIFPFGNVHLDFTQLEEPPMWGLSLAQPRLEAVLAQRAEELGAEIRRGHEVVGLSQDEASVTAEVDGPEGRYQVSARFLVGCDGPRSPVRKLVGIAFPGTSYPEVNRIGQLRLPDTVTRLENGDLDVPGLGRIQAGFTRTDRGVFAFGWTSDNVLMVNTIEDEDVDYDDNEPLAVEELRASIRRVLGADLPLGEPHRLSRWSYQARQAEQYRAGRVFLAGDATHLFPATGIGLNVGMLDAVNLAWKLGAALGGWAPDGLLDSYHVERHLAGARGMLHTQAQVALRRGLDPASDALRELFLELVSDEAPLARMGRLLAGTDIRYPSAQPNPHPLTGTFAPDLALHTAQGTTSVGELMQAAHPVLVLMNHQTALAEVAGAWGARVDLVTAQTDDRVADALLLRPDAHVAWAAGVGEPVERVGPTLRAALTTWFGEPA